MLGAFKQIIILGSFLMVLLSYQNCAQVFDADHREGADNSSLSTDEQLVIVEGKALQVLNKNCASCHGPDAANQPIDILNLDKMIADGYVVVGEPQSSPLFIEIVDGLMPQNGTMAPEDKELLRLWILGRNASEDDLSAILAPPAPDTGGAEAATYQQVAGLLLIQCGSCHLGAGNAQGGVTLNEFTDVRRYVSPGSPAGSALYNVVARDEMPPNNPLTPAEKQVIFSWISAGAQNN
ncbi:MAG: hypothetical protein H6626_03165 [Pseudobdellovibrionaceae bacterium]|nr:hypothetical protein [Bdellovibrionales bacterium]USN48103.1 MAG: hypothetical protein H6626_03165 [Pseudobdellovibrionaceae bacterium]